MHPGALRRLMPFRLLAAAALAALLGLLAARPAGAARSDRLVLKLRTGDVAFQEIETNASSSGGLSGIGTGPRNGGGLPGRRSPWGPLAGVSQYLVALRPGSGPRQQRRLVGMLREYEAAVLDYIPDHTWVVLADERIFELRKRFKIKVGSYLPSFKIAPEWAQVMRADADALGASVRSRGSGGGGGAATASFSKAARNEVDPMSGRRLASDAEDGNSSSSAPLGSERVLRPSFSRHNLPAGSSSSSPSAAGTTDAHSAGATAAELLRIHFIQVRFASPDADDLSLWTRGQAASVDVAAGAIEAWRPTLEAIVSGASPQCGLGWEPRHSTDLLVSVCAAALHQALQWLAQQPLVSWLAPYVPAQVSNLRASGIVQAGAATSQSMPLSTSPTSTFTLMSASADPAEAAGSAPAAGSGLFPFWQAGLNGEGQVVGIADTGVDLDSCFFFDPAVETASQLGVSRPELSKLGAPDVRIFDSTAHRKVRLYVGLDGARDESGHGTNTAGSLGGVPATQSLTAGAGAPVDAATGIAPGAKLSVLDYPSRFDSIYGLPTNLGDGHFDYAYDRAGARVHSDSWNGQFMAYDTFAQSLDKFTWERQDFVSVFSVGNAGEALAPGSDGSASAASSGTILSPATAKNVISVGAALNPNPERPFSPLFANLTLTFRDAAGNVLRAPMETRLMLSQLGASWGETLCGTSDVPLAKPFPIHACSSLRDPSALRGRLVVVSPNGGCTMAAKLAAVQAAGALGMLVTNYYEDYWFNLDGVPAAPPTIPAGAIMFAVGGSINSALDGGQRPVAAVACLQPPTSNDADNLAFYSSTGPAPDGRIKPEIVAPSDAVLTAGSADRYTTGTGDRACAREETAGTSLAAPLVAGAAAIVRQYFLGGFHVTGANQSRFSHSPSGPLVKAVLLGGAAPMGGMSEWRVAPLPAFGPNHQVGFGRLDLSRALPLKGVSRWRLRAVDMARLGQGQSHTYTLRGTGGPVTLTLSWYDYPAHVNAAKQLVNDLDLSVVVKQNAVVKARLSGNGAASGDSVNTVERIEIPALKKGAVLTIKVTAQTIFAKAPSQPYALVALGRFTGALRSQNALPGTLPVRKRMKKR